MRKLTVAGLIVAGVAGLMPPSGASHDPDHGHGHTHEVALRHGAFDPKQVEVGVGETLTWVNEDDEDPQSVTADDGSFDSHPGCSAGKAGQCMGPGDKFRFTFRRPGRFPYYSRTEGGPGGQGMSGVVVVSDGH